MNAPIKNSIAALVPELTEWRRDFHRHPELLYQCRRTAKLVAERLREFGFDEVHEGIGRTGVVGLLHGAERPGDERRASACCCAPTWTRCRSSRRPAPSTPRETPGTMHACGHDGHTTLLLGAAKHLAGRPRLRRHAGVLLPARRGRRRRRGGDDRGRVVRALPGQGRLRPAQLAGARRSASSPWRAGRRWPPPTGSRSSSRASAATRAMPHLARRPDRRRRRNRARAADHRFPRHRSLAAGGGVDHLDPRRRGLQHHSRQGGDARRLPHAVRRGRRADRDGDPPHLRRRRRRARHDRRDAEAARRPSPTRRPSTIPRRPTSPSRRCARSRETTT